jgi:hypothetical protein
VLVYGTNPEQLDLGSKDLYPYLRRVGRILQLSVNANEYSLKTNFILHRDKTFSTGGACRVVDISTPQLLQTSLSIGFI